MTCRNCYGFGTGGALCDCPGVSLVCAVCGKSHFEHGSYPTCATHPYTADSTCGAVGTVAAGKFTGLPCPGPACVNGCVRANGVKGIDSETDRAAMTSTTEKE
jgi:hypothetical protein